jgi:hypothetical protein
MREAGVVKRMGKQRNIYRGLVGSLKEGHHLEEICVAGKII